MPLTISDTAADAIFAAAGVDPGHYDAGSMSIDFIPETGDCTVRATRILAVDASAVRAALRDEFAEPLPEGD